MLRRIILSISHRPILNTHILNTHNIMPRLHLLIFFRLSIDRIEKLCYVGLILTVAAGSATQAKSQQGVLVCEVVKKE